MFNESQTELPAINMKLLFYITVMDYPTAIISLYVNNNIVKKQEKLKSSNR